MSHGVPLHPESVEGDPLELRWVMPAGTLGFVGEVTQVPLSLAALLEDGTVAELTVEPTAVRIRLGPAHSWRAEGARVRAALQEALSLPAQWVAAGDVSSDAVVRMAVQQIIDSEVGDYVRSHGGIVELLSVCDGAVEVRLSGACAHCPASELTLTDRFERAVRARCPTVTSITAKTAAAPPGTRGWVSLISSRRR